MNRFEIRVVESDEIQSAFAVLTRVAEWLRNKGRRQRISKTTFDKYMAWQNEGANYVVIDKKEIAGVFSLPREPLVEWPDLAIDEPVVWLRALATDPDHRGKGVGAFAVGAALKLVGSAEPLFLDCVSDFLPEYYQALGLEIVAQQTRHYADESAPFEITLLSNNPT